MVVAVAVVAAGCTQRETHDQYEKKVAASYQKRVSLVRELSPDQDVEYYLTAKQAFSEDIDTLTEINPPASVQQGHEAYVRSLEGSVELLQRLADCRALSDADFARGRDCVRKITTTELDAVQNDFQEAKAIFEAEGYDLEGATGTDDAGA